VRILGVGPFIAYPPRRGRAARAYGLLLALSAKHDVRHFGREARPLVSRARPFEEVPVTPMFRVFRCRYPLGGRAVDWLLRHDPDDGLKESAAKRLSCPKRFSELLEWADVVVAEDPVELALCRRERPDARVAFAPHDAGDPVTVSASGHDPAAEALAAVPLAIVKSPAGRAELISRYSLDEARVAVIPNGVDPELFRPSDEADREALRRDLGLPGGTLVAVTAGDSPSGRVALAWVRRLASATPGMTFVVAGAVTRREAAGNLVTTGPVRDVFPYLRAADLALCPLERRRGGPLGLLEPLACGLPTVTFGEALTGTALEDGEHVLVTEKGERAVVAALERLAADSDLGARLGAAARAHIVEHHTWERSGALLLDALSTLLDSPNGRTTSRIVHTARAQ
jgi:glycosyltransferase involved in cell wall biosynthesis